MAITLRPRERNSVTSYSVNSGPRDRSSAIRRPLTNNSKASSAAIATTALFGSLQRHGPAKVTGSLRHGPVALRLRPDPLGILLLRPTPDGLPREPARRRGAPSGREPHVPRKKSCRYASSPRPVMTSRSIVAPSHSHFGAARNDPGKREFGGGRVSANGPRKQQRFLSCLRKHARHRFVGTCEDPYVGRTGKAGG